MKSLRGQLTLRLLVGAGALFLVLAFVAYRQVESRLRQGFDEALLATAQALSASAEAEIFGVEFNLVPAAWPAFFRPSRPDYFQIYADDGRKIAQSVSLGERSLPPPLSALATPEYHDAPLPDGRPGRSVAVRLPIEGNSARAAPGQEAALALARERMGALPVSHLNILVAKDRSNLDQDRRALVSGFLIGCALFAGGLALVVGFTVSRTLRPLIKIGAHLEGRSLDNLHDPIWQGDLPLEMAPIRSGFERFANRLTQALTREKRLVSDLAHELRTPVAELRAATDLALHWPQDSDLAKRAVTEAHGVSLRMETALTACLNLARLEARQTLPRFAPVEVMAVAAEVAQFLNQTAKALQIQLSTRLTEVAMVETDAGLLALILRNLLDNAIRHTEALREVHFEGVLEETAVSFSIRNPTASLEGADLAHIAEPFWRKEAARSDASHLGLGLTLATSAARAILAQLDFDLKDGQFEARLRLPRAPNDDDPNAHSEPRT